MSKLKHNELVKRAVKWLYSQGCGYAVGERVAVTSTGEVPDAIGFRSNCSILIECKTSKSDFKADRKKILDLKILILVWATLDFIFAKKMLYLLWKFQMGGDYFISKIRKL